MPIIPYVGVVFPFMGSLSFLFLDDFERNTSIFVAIKSSSTVSDQRPYSNLFQEWRIDRQHWCSFVLLPILFSKFRILQLTISFLTCLYFQHQFLTYCKALVIILPNSLLQTLISHLIGMDSPSLLPPPLSFPLSLHLSLTSTFSFASLTTNLSYLSPSLPPSPCPSPSHSPSPCPSPLLPPSSCPSALLPSISFPSPSLQPSPCPSPHYHLRPAHLPHCHRLSAPPPHCHLLPAALPPNTSHPQPPLLLYPLHSVTDQTSMNFTPNQLYTRTCKGRGHREGKTRPGQSHSRTFSVRNIVW